MKIFKYFQKIRKTGVGLRGLLLLSSRNGALPDDSGFVSYLSSMSPMITKNKILGLQSWMVTGINFAHFDDQT